MDLNEKILWLSLFSDTSKWTRCADKYEVRQYVEERGQGDTLVNLYGKWDKVEEIDWKKLPQSFVLKTTNGSGTVLIVKDKKSLNIHDTKALLLRWLDMKIGKETTESHYCNIVPRLIAEEYVQQSESDNKISTSLIDYKIWCFNGKAYYIWTCINRSKDCTYVSMFDRDWNYHPEMSVFNEHYREAKTLVPKPLKLNEMLNIAERLSEGFPEVRVDLYYTNNKIYFGELTFTSLGGTMDFYTQEALTEMGSYIDISKVKKVRNL
ncbi:MAG: glycosyltransferase [Bacteroidales bacterium]|nr:glycosyltransferase [Bacteroidales bacterium]